MKRSDRAEALRNVPHLQQWSRSLHCYLRSSSSSHEPKPASVRPDQVQAGPHAGSGGVYCPAAAFPRWGRYGRAMFVKKLMQLRRERNRYLAAAHFL